MLVWGWKLNGFCGCVRCLLWYCWNGLLFWSLGGLIFVKFLVGINKGIGLVNDCVLWFCICFVDVGKNCDVCNLGCNCCLLVEDRGVDCGCVDFWGILCCSCGVEWLCFREWYFDVFDRFWLLLRLVIEEEVFLEFLDLELRVVDVVVMCNSICMFILFKVYVVFMMLLKVLNLFCSICFIFVLNCFCIMLVLILWLVL